MTEQESFDQLHRAIEEMRQDVQHIHDEIKSFDFSGWGDWEPHTVGIIPMRVNGRWYFKGDTVYRQERIWGLSGSNRYRYGDEFDVLKEQHDD